MRGEQPIEQFSWILEMKDWIELMWYFFLHGVAWIGVTGMCNHLFPTLGYWGSRCIRREGRGGDQVLGVMSTEEEETTRIYTVPTHSL